MNRFNFSNNPIKDWYSNKNWESLDATAKGFFTQLVLLASQTRPYGHFSSDEKKLKRLFGLPSRVFMDNDYDEYKEGKNDLTKTLKKYFDEKQDRFNLSIGMIESLAFSLGDLDFTLTEMDLMRNYDLWLNLLWEKKWKPSLLDDLVLVIDAELTTIFPELSDKMGDYFIPIAYHLGMSQNNKSVSNQEKTREKPKQTKKKEKVLTVVKSGNAYFNVASEDEIKEDLLMLDDLNYINIFNFKNVLKSLLTPLTDKEKETIWDLGIKLISSSDKESDLIKGRKLMARAMKEFGKEMTVSAITKMSLIKEKQLNPQAYFFKLLNIEKEELAKLENKKKANIGANNTYISL